MLRNYLLLFIICATICIQSHANDGAFYAKGNQLIPITESDITIKKEILTLKKVRNQFIEVTVYYEFFNPKEEKTITVGFEAFSPLGDVEGAPKNGKHPYMRDFTVELNRKILTYQVAYVENELYVKNGTIKSIDLDKFKGNKTGNVVDFHYVYHFKANFKKGLNIIKHTYNYDISGGVCYNYMFDYVLTAANRWGNNQIDDFTLIVDNGKFETFDIQKTFFKNNSDWLINGIGKMESTIQYDLEYTKFHIQKGTLVFQKKDFKPKGELFVSSSFCPKGADASNYLPFSYYSQYNIPEPVTDFERKVLKNLPFARRGYVFKNTALKKYYEKLDWYIPNPNYIPIVEYLTPLEKEWIEKYKE